MEMKVVEFEPVPEGEQQGVIISVKEREKPFQSIDVRIEVKVNDKLLRITASYAAYLSKTSKLGVLLSRFGATVVKDAIINPREILLGKKCAFNVKKTMGKDGMTYSNVERETLRPLQEVPPQQIQEQTVP